jgi:hypothetical protein
LQLSVLFFKAANGVASAWDSGRNTGPQSLHHRDYKRNSDAKKDYFKQTINYIELAIPILVNNLKGE